MGLYVANSSFGEVRAGEVLELPDPSLWQSEIDAGFLTAIDEEGDRIVDLPVPKDIIVVLGGGTVSDLGDDDIG